MRKCSSDYLILALKCDLHSLSIIGDLLFKIFGTEQTTSPSLEPRPDSRSTLQGKLQIIFWVLGRKAGQRSGRILRTFPWTRCTEAPPLPPWKEGTAQLHTPSLSELGGLGKAVIFSLRHIYLLIREKSSAWHGCEAHVGGKPREDSTNAAQIGSSGHQ